MTSVALKFALNLVVAIVLFLALRGMLGFVPALSKPVVLGWGIAEVLALVIALYAVGLARRRIAMFRI